MTGGTGFVGSHLAEKLVERGYTVYCLVRKNSNLQWLNSTATRRIEGDIFSQPTEEIIQVIGSCHYVYHVAGCVMGLQRGDYFDCNANGTRNILEAVMQSGVTLRRFVLISSIAAVGPGEGERPVDETRSPRPVSWYGESKLEAERITKTYEDIVPATIIRAPSVYGPRDYSLLGFFRAMNKGINVKMGKGTRTNFVFVSDLIQGIIQAAESDQGVGQTFYIGNEENLTTHEAMGRIAAALYKKVRIIRIPIFIMYGAAALAELKMKVTGRATIFNWQKVSDMKQENWTIDISKAKQVLGYRPEITLEEGGKKTYNWYTENSWLP